MGIVFLFFSEYKYTLPEQNKHWIVVIMDDTMSDQEVMDLVDISYEKSCQ